jgi:hypothetical protein
METEEGSVRMTAVMCMRHDFRPCREEYLHLKIVSNIFTVRFSYEAVHRAAPLNRIRSPFEQQTQ